MAANMLVVGVHPVNEVAISPETRWDGKIVVLLEFGDIAEAEAFISALHEQSIPEGVRFERVRQKMEAMGDSADPSRIE